MIPFRDALDGAAVRAASLASPVDDAPIIGNGDINALIWSDPQGLVMTLTKNDVWDARLDTSNDPPLPTLDLIRQRFTHGGEPLRSNDNSHILPGGGEWPHQDSYVAHAYPCPRACGRVRIRASGAENWASELDLRRAVVRLGPRRGGCEARALLDRNIFLIRGRVDCVLEAIPSDELPAPVVGEHAGADGLAVQFVRQAIPGDADWQGLTFAVALGQRGTTSAVAVATSLESADPVGLAVRLVRETLQDQADGVDLVRRHEKAWEAFWSRSGVAIGDPLLEATWYRSLYFLRCVSRPGVQCPGLFAGLITDKPAWHGDYHTNYNLQQIFWGCLAANHPDLAEPYEQLIHDYLPRAQWLAEKIYGMGGAVYPHVLMAYEPALPQSCVSPNGRQFFHHTWGMTLGVTGFTAQVIWWRYKYDPDITRLRETVYPVVRGVADFYAEFVERCEPRGDSAAVRLGPSVSPEHWGWRPNFDRNFDCPFDIAMVRYTLDAAAEAASTLGVDGKSIKRWRAAAQRLPAYPTAKPGEGDGNGNSDAIGNGPVVVDVAGAPVITYNIAVPATPVFPGDVVRFDAPPEQLALFRRTIDSLRWNGNNSTVMLAVARARLSMDATQAWLATEIRERLRPNGTLALNRLQPPQGFNNFGHYTEQFGVAMAIAELMLQSVGDTLRLFPALAPGTPARFRSLRAQGGFLVTASHNGKRTTTLKIESTVGGPLRLLNPWPDAAAISVTVDGKSRRVRPDARGIVTLATRTGQTLAFKPAR